MRRTDERPSDQAAFAKVSRLVILPLTTAYGALGDGFSQMLVDDLGKYPEDVLTKAVKKVRQERKTKPSIAHIVEACDFFKPSESAVMPHEWRDKMALWPEEPSEDLIANLMHSPAGRQAIKNGGAHDLYVKIKHKGLKHERDINPHEFLEASIRFREHVAEVDGMKPSTFKTALQGMIREYSDMAEKTARKWSAA